MTKEKTAEEYYDKWFGKGYWEEQYKPHIVQYAKNHHQAQLQELLEEVDDMYGDAMAPPQSAESGYNHAIEKVLDLITSKLNTNHE